MTIRTFHVCAMAQDVKMNGYHFFHGIVESARASSDPYFYAEIQTCVAADMRPTRSPGELVVLSLSLLDTRDE